MSVRESVGTRFAPLLLALIAAVRLIHLDADPGFVKSLLNNASDVGDEAYWSAAARNLILFGTPAADDYLQAATSPFYSVMVYASYWLFGVSMYTSRLPNALLGIVAVLLAYRLFEPCSKPAAFLAGLVLAVENNFFIHTRMGQVEAPCSVLALLSFYLLIRAKAPFWAGTVFGLSAATKIVALLLTPAFALFFLLQAIRDTVRPRDVVSFIGGLAVVGAIAVSAMSAYGTVKAVQGGAGVGNPVQLVVDFVTGYDQSNPTHYEGEVVLKNAVMQSQGMALMRNPARVIIDFVTGYYLSYPTTVLLVLLFGGYAWKARLAMWVGKGAYERLRRVTDVEIMVVAWLAGHAIGMLLLSDMHNRRMNFFTIPLALVPALLILRREEAGEQRPRGIQVALLCMPPVYAGTLLARKALVTLTGLGTGWSLAVAGVVMVIGACAVVVALSRASAVWWARAGWVSLMGWGVLASMSFGYSLPVRILPNLGMTGQGTKAAVVAGFLIVALVAGILSRKKAPVVVALVLVLSTTLDTADVFGRPFSARDASLHVNAMTTPDDWVIGDGAHVLSLNASYYPVQAYPGRGINRDFAAKVKPRFLSREVDHRDKRLNDPDYTKYSVTEADLYAIGASRVEPIAEFPLYPVLDQPGELTYRFYRVTY